MVRHKYWRIIAIIVIVVLFALLLGKLFNNTKAKLRVLYTGDFAYYIAKTIAEIQQSASYDDSIEINKIIKQIEELYPDITNIAVIKGRYFIAHTNQELIDKKISKVIFDTQRELKKKAGETDPEKPYVIWKKSEENNNLYNIYFPVEIDDKIVEIVFLETRIQTFCPINISALFIYLIFLILIFVLIALDRFIPKFRFLIGSVLFILTIILIVNIIDSKLQVNLNEWNLKKDITFTGLQEHLTQLNVGVSVDSEPLTLQIEESTKTWKFTLSFIGVLFMIFIFTGAMENFFETIIKHRLAYAYILPAMFGVFLLVFFPFIYGILIGFTDYNLTNFGGDLIEYFSNFKNYGFNNFYNILKVINFKDYSNFYFTLAHTVLWTVLNLAFHISIGVGLALLLNDMRLRGRTAFRILLILPWAIPNYITALIWRGMFHKQFGAVNGLLELLGFEPISWFTQPGTAFMTNLATNVWLGFPFMMIIALGALQSIPKELYEASAIDGSTKWQTFWNVTVPLLRPAMVPAIILGTIWTFNQFNVIYLVSGGGPDGSTELLITDAYKLAFEQYRYGYAAAYCIIIFVVLLSYGVFTSKITRATKGAYE